MSSNVEKYSIRFMFWLWVRDLKGQSGYLTLIGTHKLCTHIRKNNVDNTLKSYIFSKEHLCTASEALFSQDFSLVDASRLSVF